jgi:hypothetical protein
LYISQPGLKWGTGPRHGSFTPGLDHRGATHNIFRVYTDARVYILFEQLYRKPPFEDESLRLEFLRRLNEIPGLNLSVDMVAKNPAFALARLKDQAALEQFLDTLDWIVEVIKRS